MFLFTMTKSSRTICICLYFSVCLFFILLLKQFCLAINPFQSIHWVNSNLRSAYGGSLCHVTLRAGRCVLRHKLEAFQSVMAPQWWIVYIIIFIFQFIYFFISSEWCSGTKYCDWKTFYSCHHQTISDLLCWLCFYTHCFKMLASDHIKMAGVIMNLRNTPGCWCI